MIGDKIAVIDLGSNTFHLLICEVRENNTWVEIHKERSYVKLASGGLESINEEAQQRAIDAMVRFSNLITKHEVLKTRAIGTAALREAINGTAIAEKLSDITGIKIEIIDGQLEAHYIFLGIKSALSGLSGNGLIMDIGGGSVEFILYNDDEVAFAESFKIGVAVLYRMFHKSDPISEDEIRELEDYIASELYPLIEFLDKAGTVQLIGASGSFEVIYDMVPKKSVSTHWAELELSALPENLDRIIHSSYADRKMMPQIPDERIDYIVVACLLIRFVRKNFHPDSLLYCDYALKEGVIAEMMN